MRRPNILLIFTDQQRADTIHAAGNPVIRTPHLDRLVREGTRFAAAYTPSPVCVPARCSLHYGFYPHRTGCFDNGDPMPADRPSFMQVLTEAGYRTHGIGKMHFTPDAQALRGFQTRERQAELRKDAGEDDYLRFLHENGFGHVYDPMGCRGEMYYVPQPAQVPARFHATQWVGDRAEAFLRGAGRAQPFFLMVSFIHPHPPFSPPTPWNKLYRGPLMPLPKRPHQSEALWTYHNRRQNRYKYRDNGIDNNLVRMMRAYYYACISFIDFQVGRILAALEETGCLDDTLVLFASDQVRLPGRFPAGRVCETPVSLVDVMPTFLSAAGRQPADYDLDGCDLAGIAAEEETDRTVFSQYQCAAQGNYMVLGRRWKYVYSAPDRREYLFDRVRDPEETRNRAGVTFCREALKTMRAALIGRLREDGYTEPLEGDRWRPFPQPEVPADPDAGLLIQDAPWAAPHQHIPGYSDA